MMRLTTIITIALALLVGGCVQRYRPIENIDRAMPPGVERLSLDRTRDIIIAAGKQFDWSMTPIAPGHLEATERTEKFSATVDIYYTPVRLQILLKSSVNLMQTATTIHAHYNLWVRNLEASIISNLTSAVSAPPPPPPPPVPLRR
jgi:PBP1b-binding outer membrane lipoprotein LpoB